MAFLLLIGCVDSPETDKIPGYQAELEFQPALSIPVVVNATETHGGLWHRVVLKENCSIPDPIKVHFIRVWDREGMVWEKNFPVGNQTEQWFWIPLEGDPPWIVAGERHHCSWLMRNKLFNITSGYQLNQHPSLEYSLNTARTFYNLSFELQTGNTKSRRSWEISDYAWGAHGGFPVIDENGSAFEGTIRLYYPNGELWREDRWDVTGRGASFMPLMPFPGEHEIVIESNLPSLLTLEGRYELLYMEFDEKICDHGFDWDFC